MTRAHGPAPILLLLCLLPGCSPPRQQDNAAPEHRPRSAEQLEGRVFVTGQESESAVTLVTGDGQSITLLGDLEPELRRLAGATVRVYGSERRASPTPGLYVERYDALVIDGSTPAVGTLIDTPRGLSLAGRDTVELTSVPEDLRGKHGAKVWIVGPREGAKLEVQSYGILREPSN